MAGGMGTRGRPYTDYFPKAMTPIDDRPAIDYIVEYIYKFDFIEDVVIVADFAGLGGQIKNYYQNHARKIHFIQDSGRGTGGDLLHIGSALGRNADFVLWFADNLCAVDLNGMRDMFQNKKSLACIATRSRRREETGFAVVDDGIIKKFMEKPVISLHMSECLGVYMLKKRIISIIRAVKKRNINLSYDVLQPLSLEGKISSFDIGSRPWIDAESPVVLERNKNTVKRITRQMGSANAAQTRQSRP